MNYRLIIAAFIAAIAARGVAKADTIDFSQFTGTLGSSITGTTEGGDSVTITGPGFQLLVQGTNWAGLFYNADSVLFDNFTSGPVTLSFGTPLSSLSLAAESENYGLYTETAIAYDGETVVDTESTTATSTYSPGTVTYLAVNGTDITSVVFTTTNDLDGFALDGGYGAPVDSTPTSTPEPASITILGIGLVGVGVARRRLRA